MGTDTSMEMSDDGKSARAFQPWKSPEKTEDPLDKVSFADTDSISTELSPFRRLSLDNERTRGLSSSSMELHTRSSNLCSTPIPESEEFRPPSLDVDRPQEVDFSSIDSPDNDSNILWKGVIFKNVQSLRHFKDSKSFCDHVLKTGELRVVRDHFQHHILDYQAPLIGNGMKMSKSYCTVSKLKSLATSPILLVSSEEEGPPPIRRQGSFPRLGVSDQYHSIMDEFIKSLFVYIILSIYIFTPIYTAISFTAYFFNPGFELLAGETPSDWQEIPTSKLFTDILATKQYTDSNAEKLFWFANELNKLWKTLYRVVNKNVSTQPYRYSFIPLKHPGIFIPGGRFREVYYWDSLWIIQGLLTCGMIDSARRLTENLADLVDRFGFVPNGTRKVCVFVSKISPLQNSKIQKYCRYTICTVLPDP